MSDTSIRAPETPARGIFSTVFILTIARTCINMTRRFTYTFVPEIARALGVPVTGVQNGIALQSSMSMLSPFFGGLSERYGRKYVLIAALLTAALLGFVGAAAPLYGVFLAVMVGFGVGKMLFDPAGLAYLGDRVPYHRRALAIGMNEMSWGAALLIGAPLTGLLLERATLSSVFLMLGVANLLGAALIFVFLPGDRPKREAVQRTSLRSILRAVSGNPAAMGAMAYAACNSAANEMIFINYGAFMEQSFGLALSALGIVTVAIAVAEGAGEAAVAGIGDRMGPKRMALAGAAVAAVCYAIFPVFGSAIPVVVIGIFTMFLGYEISVVAAIPLYTEVLPGARASIMGAIIGAVALGRVIGGLSGALLYNNMGVVVTSLAACVVLLVGMFTLWRAVHVRVERE